MANLLRQLSLAIALALGLATPSFAQQACVIQSCSPGSGVTIGTSATTICTLPVFSSGAYLPRGSYTYEYDAILDVTNTGVVTTTTINALGPGGGASAALTGIASVTVPMFHKAVGTFTPATSTTYPGGNTTGLLSALGAAATATATTNSIYVFKACPQAVNSGN